MNGQKTCKESQSLSQVLSLSSLGTKLCKNETHLLNICCKLNYSDIN